MAVGAACTPVAALLSLWITRLIARLLDALAAGEADAALLGGWCALLVAVGVVQAAARFLGRRLVITASRRVEAELKDDLTRHLLRLPVPFFDKAGSGDLISRFTQDVELVRFLIGPAVLYGSSAVVVLPGALWMMGSLSLTLTAAVAAAFGLLILSTRWLMPRLQAASRRVQEAIGAISDRALQDFMGIRVLTTFAMAGAEAARLRELTRDYQEQSVAANRLRALYDLFVSISVNLVILLVLVLGGYQVVHGELSIGSLFQFLLLLGLLTWPLIAVGWILGTYPRALAAMRRIEELFAVAPEPPPPASGPRQLRGDIEVRGLTFRYADRDAPALADVSFTIRAGQKLGLVGPVGAGKSTILALLTRLYDPPPGTVFVDGHDVLDIDAAVLRRTFAVASQDPFLFSDTIAANVGFGSDADLPDAAELAVPVHAAALDQDLDELQNGLQTLVGERGVTLSGGQKQRVSLARALAAERPALLLDDTLSAVDHDTERRILDRLRDARGARTMIIASHRITAVADADWILVLDAGRVVQQGRHRTLLGQVGPYRRYHRLQTEADALEGDGA